MLATDTRFIDFAFTYAGMGHVTIFFADPLTKVRTIDGGSNNYDRQLNARAHAERKDVSRSIRSTFWRSWITRVPILPGGLVARLHGLWR